MNRDVVVAILAKDKAFALPFYLQCIYNQTYPKQRIHIYIRTNDNKDETASILHEFVNKHRRVYASMYIDDTNISETLKTYKHHEWNTERFKILGTIRQESIKYAIQKNAHYFVADCDNFIVPNTIENLVKYSHIGIVAPMLLSETNYSNFHYDIDKNGYLKHHTMYDKVYSRDVVGFIDVPVVHCTYLVDVTFLHNVSYDDDSYRYEYVIFCDVMRKKGVKQYLDNRQFYGFVEFSETKEDIQTKFNTVWKYILSKYFVSDVSPKKTMIVAPNGDLAHRMRTMASTLYLANKLGMQFEHLWQGTRYQCAFPNIQEVHNKSFEYYFQKRAEIQQCDITKRKNMVNIVYTEWMPNDSPNSWYSFQSYGQKLLQPIAQLNLALTNQEMNVSDHFLIETTHMNHLQIPKEDKHAIYKEYFQPNTRFATKLQDIPNAIGVALRTNHDFAFYFPQSVIEDAVLENWVRTLEGPVYLVCDNVQKQTLLRKCLQNPIVPSFHEQETFLQFLQLTKCSKIYGTVKSAFAEEAAIFGNVEYLPLTQDMFESP